MSSLRLVSGKWVGALFTKGLPRSVTPELKAHLAALGIDLERLEAHYPHETWVRGLEVTAAELYQGEVLSEALRKLGVRVVKALQDSGEIKGPVLAMGKLMGPRRVLKHLNGQPVKGVDFLRIEVKEKSAHHLEVRFNDGALGDFVAGAFEAVLELLGGRHPRVNALVTSAEECVLELTWR